MSSYVESSCPINVVAKDDLVIKTFLVSPNLSMFPRNAKPPEEFTEDTTIL